MLLALTTLLCVLSLAISENTDVTEETETVEGDGEDADSSEESSGEARDNSAEEDKEDCYPNSRGGGNRGRGRGRNGGGGTGGGGGGGIGGNEGGDGGGSGGGGIGGTGGGSIGGSGSGGGFPPLPNGGGGVEGGFQFRQGRYRQSRKNAPQQAQRQKFQRMRENLITNAIPPACYKFYDAYKQQFRSKLGKNKFINVYFKKLFTQLFSVSLFFLEYFPMLRLLLNRKNSKLFSFRFSVQCLFFLFFKGSYTF